jgi:hypothetical protein
MTPESSNNSGTKTFCAYVASIVGCFLIVAALVWAMKHFTRPAPLGEDRAAVRAKALAELRAAETEALANPAWIDQSKGLVRLPIEDAMKLAQDAWSKSPAAARSNLISRVEKATYTPPPPPPKPSQYE